MAWDEYRYEVTSPGLGIPTWFYTMWLPLLSLAIFGRAVGVLDPHLEEETTDASRPTFSSAASSS